jgi:hypothetical protein
LRRPLRLERLGQPGGPREPLERLERLLDNHAKLVEDLWARGPAPTISLESKLNHTRYSIESAPVKEQRECAKCSNNNLLLSHHHQSPPPTQAAQSSKGRHRFMIMTETLFASKKGFHTSCSLSIFWRET